jgi:glycosyltransferase involved in cell wall biosynthesis
MKVLHVIASMSPRHGGPTDAIRGIIPPLAKNGVESFIVSTNDDLEDRLPVVPGVEVDYRGARGIYFENQLRRPRMLRDYAFCADFDSWLQKKIRNFDVVHVHALFSYLTTRAMTWAKRARVPYICRPLGVLGSWPLRRGAFHKWLYLALVERHLVNFAAAIEYNSEQERDEAASLRLRPRSEVIPLGFQPVPEVPQAREDFARRHGLTGDRVNLLFLSRLHPKKGVQRLLEACAKLPRNRFNLIIAGAGESGYVAEMQQLSERLGLGANTTWTGFLEGTEKARAMRASDVFVLPSHSESFGIVVAEAMSAGCAAVVTPEVPLAALVERQEAGWVTTDVESALREALNNSLTQKRENASHAATSITYDQVAPCLKNLYVSVVAPRKS